jgi:hypothetical protein
MMGRSIMCDRRGSETARPRRGDTPLSRAALATASGRRDRDLREERLRANRVAEQAGFSPGSPGGKLAFFWHRRIGCGPSVRSDGRLDGTQNPVGCGLVGEA